jgi:hypothetical protein
MYLLTKDNINIPSLPLGGRNAVYIPGEQISEEQTKETKSTMEGFKSTFQRSALPPRQRVWTSETLASCRNTGQRHNTEVVESLPP